MGQSTGAGSGKEKAGAVGTSPSAVSQGKAEEGGGGRVVGVTGGTSELQLRSQSPGVLRGGRGRCTAGGTQWMGVCGQL